MQTVLLIFIVLFALAIGFFLGLFLLSLDTPLTRTLTKKEEPSPDQVDQDPSGQSLPEVRKPSPDSQLILQVWREEGKSPVYDLDGKYLEKDQLPSDILNLITVQEDESPESEPPQPPPAAEVLPPPVDVIPEIEDEDEDEIDEEKMLSVVDEVNDILQKKLVGSPLAGKGIHMMENHNKEIRFWVGLDSYDDVEEIPDPEVRQIIDDSVKEWERNRA
jgi:hypothetical protein